MFFELSAKVIDSLSEGVFSERNLKTERLRECSAEEQERAEADWRWCLRKGAEQPRPWAENNRVRMR